MLHEPSEPFVAHLTVVDTEPSSSGLLEVVGQETICIWSSYVIIIISVLILYQYCCTCVPDTVTVIKHQHEWCNML